MTERERSQTGTIFLAKGLLPRPDSFVEGGGLLVVDGRVETIFESLAAVRRAAYPSVDLGEVLIAPGMICAHAHLELSALAGRTTAGLPMLAWVREVIALRHHLDPVEMAQSARKASQDLLASGATFVADIDSSGGRGVPQSGNGLRRLALREFLDGDDEQRRRRALSDLERPLEPQTNRLEGLSPHAPHTVSASLLQSVASVARNRKLPVQVHWSETQAELDWLKAGRGPFRELLKTSPRTTGLNLLEGAGLFDTTLSLVHGNHPEPDEPARLAAGGIAVVHCPGSHAFFGRERFPLEAYRSAGVTLAIGTDSLASNRVLDMRRELKLFSESAPDLEPEEIWKMATLGGAHALGIAATHGELRCGFRADFTVFEGSPKTRIEALAWLCRGLPRVKSVYSAGQSVYETQA